MAIIFGLLVNMGKEWQEFGKENMEKRLSQKF